MRKKMFALVLYIYIIHYTCAAESKIPEFLLLKPWNDTVDYQGTTIIREYVKVPFIQEDKIIELEGLLYRKSGLSSYRGVIMTHGRNGPNPSRNFDTVFSFEKFNMECALRDCAVLLLVRRGYGRSQGIDSEYLSDSFKSGMAAIEDICAGVNYLLTLPIVNKTGILIMGHSQGGWAALSASTLNRPEVLVTVNISGGTNFIGINEKSKEEIQREWIRGCEQIGRSSILPSIWIYSENDRNHPKLYVTKMFKAFEKNGGKGILRILPPYSDNGHKIINDPSLFINDVFNYVEYLEQQLK